jgi:hypothetical protein
MKKTQPFNQGNMGIIALRQILLSRNRTSIIHNARYSFLKLVLIGIVLIIGVGNSKIYSQQIPVYPIPSYNVPINGYANFKDLFSPPPGNSKGKREFNIHVKSANGPVQNCQATAWIYTLDYTTVLGPFTIECGETLTVPIDEREWGSLVESEDNIMVDVWIDEGSSKSIQGMLQKSDAYSFPLFKFNESFAKAD